MTQSLGKDFLAPRKKGNSLNWIKTRDVSYSKVLWRKCEVWAQAGKSAQDTYDKGSPEYEKDTQWVKSQQSDCGTTGRGFEQTLQEDRQRGTGRPPADPATHSSRQEGQKPPCTVHLAHDPASQPPGIYPRERTTCGVQVLTAAAFTTLKTWRHPTGTSTGD